jgi:hypothetical protein
MRTCWQQTHSQMLQTSSNWHNYATSVLKPEQAWQQAALHILLAAQAHRVNIESGDVPTESCAEKLP